MGETGYIRYNSNKATLPEERLARMSFLMWVLCLWLVKDHHKVGKLDSNSSANKYPPRLSSSISL